ncbi:LysM peptidoglycan-binding domain-containing protein [Subtercola sp. PAMC28395]|uniref:LysM peptidoglycan-binding domain-containing protein n=1 Tax=Subtercola sp. PAMC28395 TaxID=2846775 RepID=UPI001C0ABD29|nr:LysM peptidoglycan-binding domain-containing protein [Subtercola sp. PAMC28395]QWT23060.1 LysM peptidoglycan-binding domain-containing protein [Subtercola sp. PAMC28395]
MTALNFAPGPHAQRALSAPVRVHLRLTRRGRVFLGAVASMALIGAMAAFAVFGGAAAIATSSGSSSTFTYVTVQSGQSLWSIAQSIDPSGDPRDVIAAIQSLNQLPSSDVQPGQRLALPSEYAR